MQLSYEREGCRVGTTAHTGTPSGTSAQPEVPSCLALGIVDFVGTFNSIP